MNRCLKTGLIFVCVLCLLVPSFYAYAAERDELVTRRTFCRLLISELSEKYGYVVKDDLYVPFLDTYDKYIINAYHLKLVNGKTENLFAPDELISKQDIFVILKRFADYISPDTIYDNTKIKWFDDDASIADYAKPAVRLLSAIDVIGSGTFSPASHLYKSQVKEYLLKIENQVKNMPVAQAGMPSKNKVPVLMYHIIGSPPPNNYNAYLYVEPSVLEQQVKYLADNGYTFLFPDEISYADNNRKSVVITFDDGYLDNYTQAFQIFKKYNVKATIFVVEDYIAANGFCNEAQLREMSQSGLIRIYSHSKSHPDLSTLSTDQLNAEFASSQARMERITGRKCTALAYPFGKRSPEAIAVAKRYFKTAFTVNDGFYTNESNPFELKRFTVGRELDLKGFEMIFRGYRAY